MPPAKRPLAEMDLNASRPKTSVDSKYKVAYPGDRYRALDQEPPATKRQRANSTNEKFELEMKHEVINYKTKDNSRLRTFLFERGFSTSGSRDEMISRLENSSIVYESLPSERITSMLKGRGLKMSGQGSKDVKLARLRVNDKSDRDTGNNEESYMYGILAGMEWGIPMAKKTFDDTAPTLSSPARLARLRKCNLSTSGSKAAQIKRLQADQRKKFKAARDRYTTLKDDLESRVGHPLMDSQAVQEEENEQRSEDNRIRKEKEPTRTLGSPM